MLVCVYCTMTVDCVRIAYDDWETDSHVYRNAFRSCDVIDEVFVVTFDDDFFQFSTGVCVWSSFLLLKT